MNDELQSLTLRLNTLVIFRRLLQDEVILRLNEFLRLETEDPCAQVSAYTAFAAALLERGDNLSLYLRDFILEDENLYMHRRAQKLPISDTLETCLHEELRTVQMLASLTPAMLRAGIAYGGYLPEWQTSPVDLSGEYTRRIANVSAYGYGIYAKYHMFTVKDSTLVPVEYPDEIKLDQLIGYQDERRAVIDNTLALIEGRPSANVLLYGDAGTGKSSTVKAVVNQYRTRGLRLIEIAKKQLRSIPAIIDALSANPLKFILFIDDLSFSENDDDFGALKAILEGSVAARTGNIAIYATSNRRHLIRECFSDRDGDEVHRNDTIQELISLSDRFGLTVAFTKPDKSDYLQIVHGLAKQSAIALPQEELDAEAERFALRHSGRSGRVARQFVESLLARPESEDIPNGRQTD